MVAPIACSARDDAAHRRPPPVMRKRYTVRPSSPKVSLEMISRPLRRASSSTCARDMFMPSCITTSFARKRVSFSGGMPLGSGPRPAGGTALMPAAGRHLRRRLSFRRPNRRSRPSCAALCLDDFLGLWRILRRRVRQLAAMLASGESCGMFAPGVSCGGTGQDPSALAAAAAAAVGLRGGAAGPGTGSGSGWPVRNG